MIIMGEPSVENKFLISIHQKVDVQRIIHHVIIPNHSKSFKNIHIHSQSFSPLIGSLKLV